jgi:hypothetical protein
VLRTRPSLLAVLLVAALATGCGPSPQRTAAALVGADMLARVDAVTRVEVVRGHGLRDPERPYRRAAVLHDRGTECRSARRPGPSCGAIVEVYRTALQAQERAATLASSKKGTVARDGVFVLRISPRLDPAKARTYRQAFAAAVRNLDGFSRGTPAPTASAS